MAPVVLADHDDGQLWGKAVDVAVIQSPKDVLSPVSADSKVQALAVGVIVVPYFSTRAFVALDDGVSDVEKSCRFGFCFSIDRFVAFEPTRFFRGDGEDRGVGRKRKWGWDRRGCLDLGLGCGQRGRKKKEQKKMNHEISFAKTLGRGEVNRSSWPVTG